VAALLFASPTRVDMSYVHGRAVVRDARIVGTELGPIIDRHNAAAERLLT
jgi:hypothetical protein